jgi:histidinol-phosphate aminotransferase
MQLNRGFSRRGFVGGVATALGYLGLKPGADLWAQGNEDLTGIFARQQANDYDSFAKLANNENPWGPSESILAAMNGAWKYSMRYGYPDPGLTDAVAAHHGVQPDNILFGAGSGEILRVVGLAYNTPGKKVVGVEPSYMTVYQHASGLRADAITLPLLSDYTQDIPAIIRTTKQNYRDVSFVYLVNPNNPTGVIVTADEVREVLDNIPVDIPVLIDEAYHHFVEDQRYATAVPYVLEGRKVIVARTFSKIYGLAGMRLGYAIAPAHMIDEMRDYSTGSVNALVRFGGVAALKDTANEQRVRNTTIATRKKYAAQLRELGHEVLPTETNFFMVGLRRPVQPVIQEFRQKGVLVGRPFPPMTEHLRVSIGTEQEMDRFMVAFKEIFTGARATESSGG